MVVRTDGIFREADFGGVVLGVEQAGDRRVGADLLALGAEALREAAALACIDEIGTSRLVARAEFGFDHGVLQHAEGGDAGSKGRDIGLRVRTLAHVFG